MLVAFQPDRYHAAVAAIKNTPLERQSLHAESACLQFEAAQMPEQSSIQLRPY